MANSVHRDRQGPDWPLGNIVVPTPGTPVSIMSLVDTLDDPNNPVPGTSGADEYTISFQQIMFQAIKAGAGPPRMTNNTGNVYVVRKATAGAGGTTDTGVVIKMLVPGETFVLSSSALVKNIYNGYRYFIDSDSANDACQVTGLLA